MSDKSLIVIMGASSEAGTLKLYQEQLFDADIPYHVEPRPEVWPNMYGGGTLGYKLSEMKRLSEKFYNYERLIFTCAFDLLFFGTREEVIGKIPMDGILCAAERNCYPDSFLAEEIEGDTPWRFMNGGIVAGTPANFLKWIELLEGHPYYESAAEGIDQAFFNRLLAQKSPLINIDSRTELAYCLYLEQGELDFYAGVPVNLLCGTRPNFIHCNNHSIGNFWERREKSLRQSPMERLGWKTEVKG